QPLRHRNRFRHPIRHHSHRRPAPPPLSLSVQQLGRANPPYPSHPPIPLHPHRPLPHHARTPHRLPAPTHLPIPHRPLSRHHHPRPPPLRPLATRHPPNHSLRHRRYRNPSRLRHPLRYRHRNLHRPKRHPRLRQRPHRPAHGPVDQNHFTVRHPHCHHLHPRL